MERNFKNDHVIYVDAFRRAHNALVTTWWRGGNTDGAPSNLEEYRKLYGEHAQPSVNLVFLLKDLGRTDQYGFQKQHEGSVPHGDSQTPPRLGRYYLYPDEYDGMIE